LDTIKRILTRYTKWLWALLAPLGPWGVFVIAAVDAAFFGLPMDAVVAGYVYKQPSKFFLYVILGTTDTRAPRGFAPIAIGLSLTLIHLVSIPITNTSVNPARSIGPALFAGGDAIAQLWLFIVAPLLGAAIAGVSYAMIVGGDDLVAPLQEATEA